MIAPPKPISAAKAEQRAEVQPLRRETVQTQQVGGDAQTSMTARLVTMNRTMRFMAFQ